MVNTEIRLITFFAPKDGKALYSQQKQALELTVAHSDHELLIAKFRLKLKEVGKTSRPVRYDPNQIPYDYTVTMGSHLRCQGYGKNIPLSRATTEPLEA